MEFIKIYILNFNPDYKRNVGKSHLYTYYFKFKVNSGCIEVNAEIIIKRATGLFVIKFCTAKI